VRYGFTRSFARVEIAFGVLLIFAGAALAIFALYAVPRYPIWGHPAPGGRQEVVAAALVFGVGALLGTSLIVLGQLVLAFLDMRARLERIDRRLRDWKTPTEPESPLTERLRP
jgi:hypothetical protein